MVGLQSLASSVVQLGMVGRALGLWVDLGSLGLPDLSTSQCPGLPVLRRDGCMGLTNWRVR